MQTSYARVGKYNQDQINGFDEDFIHEFIKTCNIKQSETVLDAMAGNGNLSKKIVSLHPGVELTTTDISEVQCQIAKETLGTKSRVLSMDFIYESPFENEFDLIVIKS